MAEKVPVTGSPQARELTDFEMALLNRLRKEFPHGVELQMLYQKLREFLGARGRNDMTIQELQDLVLGKFVPQDVKVKIMIHPIKVDSSTDNLPIAE